MQELEKKSLLLSAFVDTTDIHNELFRSFE